MNHSCTSFVSEQHLSLLRRKRGSFSFHCRCRTISTLCKRDWITCASRDPSSSASTTMCKATQTPEYSGLFGISTSRISRSRVRSNSLMVKRIHIFTMMILWHIGRPNTVVRMIMEAFNKNPHMSLLKRVVPSPLKRRVTVRLETFRTSLILRIPSSDVLSATLRPLHPIIDLMTNP